MICPHCQKALSDNPALAGQVVKCPLCGGTFGLSGSSRPPSPLSPPPLLNQPPQFVPVVTTTPRASARTKFGVRELIRIFMLAVTILWVAGIGCLLLRGFDHLMNSEDFIRVGDILIDKQTGDKMDKSGYAAGLFAAALCFPTIPYAISMVVLGVAHFAWPKK